jgi:transcriptional regulator with XRE-family HTH domain
MKHSARHPKSDLRQFRDLIGASTREVAARAGTTAATVSRLENGRRHGLPTTRAAVAKALGEMVAEHLTRQRAT